MSTSAQNGAIRWPPSSGNGCGVNLASGTLKLTTPFVFTYNNLLYHIHATIILTNNEEKVSPKNRNCFGSEIFGEKLSSS